MSDIYRLESCSVCGVVRVALRPLRSDEQRFERIGDAIIHRVDFCPSCKADFDALQAAEGAEEIR